MHASDSVSKVLVGNKGDMPDRQVTYEQGNRLAAELGIKFFETSAKSGLNIEKMFCDIAEQIKKKL